MGKEGPSGLKHVLNFKHVNNSTDHVVSIYRGANDVETHIVGLSLQPSLQCAACRARR